MLRWTSYKKFTLVALSKVDDKAREGNGPPLCCRGDCLCLSPLQRLVPGPLSGSPRRCPRAEADSRPSYGSEDQIGQRVKRTERRRGGTAAINREGRCQGVRGAGLTFSLVSVCMSAMKSSSSLMYCLMHSMAAVVHCGGATQIILEGRITVGSRCGVARRLAVLLGRF